MRTIIRQNLKRCQGVTVKSSATGQLVAEGSGETKEEARQNLRGAMIAAGWTGDEIDQLLAEYDSAKTAPKTYPKTYPIR